MQYTWERLAHRVLIGKSEGKNHYEDLNIDGRILKWIFGIEDEGMFWIHLTLDRDMDSCERVMNLHVPRNAGNFFSD
jgi:hypothetical protein